MIGKCVVIVSNAGYRDTIYVGIIKDITESWVALESAVNVLRYREVGVAGISARPDMCSVKRAPTGAIVRVMLRSVIVINDADHDEWSDYLSGAK